MRTVPLKYQTRSDYIELKYYLIDCLLIAVARELSSSSFFLKYWLVYCLLSLSLSHTSLIIENHS